MGWNHSIDVRHLPRIDNHAEATQAWEKSTSTVRGQPTRKRFTRTQWMDKHSNGDISFSLYGNEIVRYLSDGDVMVDRLYTRNFCEFATRLVPSDINVINSNLFRSHGVRPMAARYWRTDGTVRLAHRDERWHVVSGSEGFRVVTFDKAAARASLARTEYNNFRLWAKGVIALDGWSRDRVRSRDRLDVMAMLADPAQWGEALTSGQLTGFPQTGEGALLNMLNVVRDAIYSATPGVVSAKEEPHIDGDLEFEKYKRMNNTYAHLTYK